MKIINLVVIVLAMALAGQCYGDTGTADPNAPAQSSADEKKGVLPIPDYTGDIWTRSYFTGDWYGERMDLAQKGIMFDLRLSQYYQNVTSGGRNTNGNVRDTWGSELYYNARITPSLHVTPNIQLVQNAQDDDDMAVILGVRAVMDF